MSVTKHVACKTCRKRLWIGQSNRLYRDSTVAVDPLTQFLLIDHSSGGYGRDEHLLITFDEHALDDDALRGYEEINC